ncbi:LPS export ABC transporter periplasmic protein LptC [Oricola thermophila]|uniref:LPS export ABC transporter periplasmic protein LptC n=1 Tax=Oricola thermophila TaxID=2742145 RepID=A0A6N1VFD0_9HYPH|nr:LPS export ABC transporter periplasmic protein LptC [Oricola thermophila]QKV19554.1 LPS export ABC transporter periplasmic protein LptC [Oricola thermophila]
MQADTSTGAADPAQMHGGRRQGAYRSALAHSGRVRLARLALPALAVAVLLVMVLVMVVSRATPTTTLDLSGSAIRDGKLVMASPKLDGFTADGRPYSMRAARAIQDLAGSGAIDLERIQAKVEMTAGVEANVLADSGIFDSEANTLDIMQSLSVETSDGKRADLGSAAIDLADGVLTTDDPVRISLPGAVLEADRLRVEDNGRRMVFESRVRLVVQPGAIGTFASEGEAAAGPGG